MGPFEMVAVIVFMSLVTGTIHKYLETSAKTPRTRGGDHDRSVLRAVEDLRAEIAAMKQREAEAILTFDTTLQNLDARLKHLEKVALTTGSAGRSSLSTGATHSAEEPAQAKVSQAA
jgi:hypothetical protein